MLTQAQVLQTQAQDFAATQCAEQHRLDHGPVTAGPQSSQELAGLVRGQDPRQGVGSADQRDPATARPACRQAPRDGIAVDVPARDEEGEQAADAGQSALDRASRWALLPVIDADDVLALPRLALRLDERQHIASGHLGRIPDHDLEETLRSNAVANTVFGRTLAVTNRR